MPLPALCLFLFLAVSAADGDGTNDLVRSSCQHASYPDVCVRSLASYTGPAKTPRDVARAAVKVSLTRARRASDYLSHVSASVDGGKKERAALSDCVEQVSDSVDALSRTLKELEHLSSGTSFQWQMSNAKTWVSAALTNEDTCLDGFRDVHAAVKSDVRRKITDVAKVTSNALYMINRLDTTRRSAGPHLRP